ncbi:hypothetical protein LX97_01549 [Nonlabens dokdonensis]|jgi:hypothetical protein|uniref:Arginyl-tRNA synthetase n=2 Tax=Nonlabens dokdonensis TaxID=328515 RepID=L7WAM1_NONDD|nr:hypothetical protein [Nonlabens dokdonensis]AGC77242.1 arginyl-tRNA synthetase [Nonlabens dokdonensis DSW-6]PZX40777.1 hypothetical protein LX97_01549 [Nonlabens dokdonensis]
MLYNVSYNNKKIDREISEEVGAVLTLKERWKLKGSGSPKLFITSCSIQIHNLLILDNNANSCNVEIREKGIIVRFRSLLETFALPIPYYKLTIYKGRAQEYSIHKDNYFVKLKADHKRIHKFFDKLSQLKSDQGFEYIDDL